VGYADCMREKRNVLGFWWENLKERNHVLDLGIYETMLLKEI
jgi:hypothetical protein